MTDTIECQALTFKWTREQGLPTLWAIPFEYNLDAWELVNTCEPHSKGMTGKELTMETYLDACRKFTTYPEEFIQEIERECELIPLTITYTY